MGPCFSRGLKDLRFCREQAKRANDNAAKKTAEYLGLTVTGTIGVLIKAKKLGHLDAIRPVLNEIKEKGFYIGTALEKMVLEQAGE